MTERRKSKHEGQTNGKEFIIPHVWLSGAVLQVAKAATALRRQSTTSSLQAHDSALCLLYWCSSESPSRSLNPTDLYSGSNRSTKYLCVI